MKNIQNRIIFTVVVGGYKKIENGVLSGFSKITDGCVKQFLTKENETVEEAIKKSRVQEKNRK